MDYRQCAEKFMEFVSNIHGTRNLDSLSRFSRGEAKFLENLHDHGGKMQAKELAHKVGISTARVTAILNMEEEKGYIRREAIAGDRRKINIILTESGEKEYQRRHQEVQDRFAAYFEFLGEDDTEHFFCIMNRTKEFMEARRKENQGE